MVVLFYIIVEILSSRQKKAEALKKLTDVAVRMSEEQLVELRADIKVNLQTALGYMHLFLIYTDWAVGAEISSKVPPQHAQRNYIFPVSVDVPYLSHYKMLWTIKHT